MNGVPPCHIHGKAIRRKAKGKNRAERRALRAAKVELQQARKAAKAERHQTQGGQGVWRDAELWRPVMDDNGQPAWMTWRRGERIFEPR